MYNISIRKIKNKTSSGSLTPKLKGKAKGKAMKKVKMQKKMVEVEVPVFEQGPGGFEELFGETVVIWAGVYIYSGVLSGVNTDDILLTDALVVYETGTLVGATFKDAQPVPGGKLWLRKAAIEAYYKRA